ncbi:MAG TPA: hypothetical protein VKA89_07975 [Solirubrobacterales bacterium]|nr:hypothetical protein [Solirubrobacterales bacterium]
MSPAKTAKSWTCGRCGVTASWMPGTGEGRPADWEEVEGELHCLVCRRAVAGEEGVEAEDEEKNAATRARIRTAAVIEFEIRRDPSRANGTIARACRTSVPAVVKVRQRIGIPAPKF